jgi:Cysteine-rich secretory protein family
MEGAQHVIPGLQKDCAREGEAENLQRAGRRSGKRLVIQEIPANKLRRCNYFTSLKSCFDIGLPTSKKEGRQMLRFVPLFALLAACSLCSADARYPRSAGELKAMLQILGPQSNDVRDLYLSRIRQFRLICNVPHENITWDDEQEKLAIAASDICSRLNQLTHTPERPAGMNDADYELGRNGARSCNIAMGTPKPIQSVNSWMDDSDDMNIQAVGHRRWILNPSMARTAFGSVGNFSAMYAFDYSRKNVPEWDFTAFPARGYMPLDYFGRHV